MKLWYNLRKTIKNMSTSAQPTEHPFNARIREIQLRLQILDLMIKEIVGNAGRNPMSHETRQDVLRSIKSEESMLRAEYFVLKDAIPNDNTSS